MALEISTATIKDVGQLVVLVNSAYRGDGKGQGWTNEAHLLEGTRTDSSSLENLIEGTDEVIFKAIENENLVGCVHLQKTNGTIYLGLLSVLPSTQAKGIGKELLNASEEYARQHNCTSIIITVISARGELIEWYKRKGFIPTGEIKPFHAGEKFGIQKQPLQLVEMIKTL